jgi:hypothetical protein
MNGCLVFISPKNLAKLNVLLYYKKLELELVSNNFGIQEKECQDDFPLIGKRALDLPSTSTRALESSPRTYSAKCRIGIGIFVTKEKKKTVNHSVECRKCIRTLGN